MQPRSSRAVMAEERALTLGVVKVESSWSWSVWASIGLRIAQQPQASHLVPGLDSPARSCLISSGAKQVLEGRGLASSVLVFWDSKKSRTPLFFGLWGVGPWDPISSPVSLPGVPGTVNAASLSSQRLWLPSQLSGAGLQPRTRCPRWPSSLRGVRLYSPAQSRTSQRPL